MSITMQGNWTVRVKSKSAAWQQRFQITGSTSADGTYPATEPGVFVTGAQWAVKVQHKPPSQPWQDSDLRLTDPSVTGGLLQFDIRSNDGGSDEDYNDLVLQCTMPISATDFVVYGRARTYTGHCLFNPCYVGYWVIDRPSILQEALGIPELRHVIEKLYPERIKPRRPIPLPDPPPDFKPLVIPTGLTEGAEVQGLVFRSNRARLNLNISDFLRAEGKGKARTEVLNVNAMEHAAVEQLEGTAQLQRLNAAPLDAGAARVAREDLYAVAQVVDKLKLRRPCTVEAAPGLLLQFQEYDRTEAEKLGGPYSGEGTREDLGLAVTDEQGHYLFRFSRSLDDLATEAGDVALGETYATQIRPDVIVRVLGTGFEVDYESAPYYNIPNLRRIDLCLPYDLVHPSRACAGDRVIQRIGDVIVLHSALGGSPNTLDGSGRITCRNANAPQVDCAAWRGGLRVYACFGKPDVAYYSLRYRRVGIDAGWHFVDETHKLNYIPAFAPGYTGTPVGSTMRSAQVDGGAAQTVPTYASHEGDLNWIENDLKVILSSGLYRPFDNPGPVHFRIQAYTAAGALVTDTTDTLTLYIDNRPTTGDIVSITMGSTTLGDCALFDLTDPKAPLTLRYRAVDPEGFVQRWTLSATRGNNVPKPVTVSGGVVPKSYTLAPGACVSFRGTADEPSADLDNYVQTTLIPASGADWLPTGVNFCAFAFTLEAYDRTTNGRTAYPRAVFWQDLIGLSYTPAP